jgi:hypothetical protein
MVRHRHGLFERAAVLETCRNSRCPEPMVADFGFDTSHRSIIAHAFA